LSKQMNEAIKKSAGSPEEDAALVKAFQTGNKPAFDKLVLKHKNRIFNFCYRFLGDYQEANDAAQETFLKAYRSLKKFRFEAIFSTWLYRIAVNTCKNRLMSSEYRHKNKMVCLDNPGSSEGGSPSVEIGDESRSPMAELEKKERLTLIQKAINLLPAEHKAVVVLRDIEGLSYEEITHATGLNLGTVKSRLARARLDLRKKLGGAI
jgi:RNA polymerase sigma-70 factor (ECF subfamily)